MQRRAIGKSVPQSLTSVSVLIFALSLSTGCSKAAKPVAEAPPGAMIAEAPAPPQTVQATTPQPATKLPEPKTNEVQEAVKRVFKEAVSIDTSRKPTFMVGDFNGDQSQDIAVMLKPATDKLVELNEEFPNWILRDLAGPSQTVGPRFRVAANDKLLAIIHGYDTQGWRAPQATQTFLLKNASRSSMEVYSAKEFKEAHQGSKLPQMRGDLLGEEIGSQSGCLYYSGATYAWYDPKTFSSDTEQRLAHMGGKKK